MNPFLLQTALRDYLTPVLETLPLLARQKPVAGQSVPPSVPDILRPALIRIGDVLPLQAADAETVPFVCLQERGGHDSEGVSVVDVIIRCAVYSPEPEEAAHELVNLLQTVRHALMPLTAHPLQGRFRLNCDDKGHLLPWETPTEQNHPYAESYILSVWEYKSIEGVMP